MAAPTPPAPLDRPALARAAAAAMDAGATPAAWATAFSALGLRPPPPSALAVELPPTAPRPVLEASFAALAAGAAAESVSRSGGALTEGLFAAAWAACGGGALDRAGKTTAAVAGAPEAGGAPLAAAVASAGLSLDLPTRLRAARAPSDLARAAAAGGGVPFVAFRAALLADGT